MINNKKGQALMEILVGLFVVGVLAGTGTTAIIIALRSNLQSKNFQDASALNQKIFDNAKIVAEANWHNIYDLTKGSATQYYLTASGTALAILVGTTSTVVDNVSYTQFFSVENVNRDGSGNIAVSGSDDPSTQKIVSHCQWTTDNGQTSEVTLTGYLTRWHNSISQQTDWSGGDGQTGPLSDFGQKFSTSTSVDFSATPGSIMVQF